MFGLVWQRHVLGYHMTLLVMEHMTQVTEGGTRLPVRTCTFGVWVSYSSVNALLGRLGLRHLFGLIDRALCARSTT
jgi:hypothetical protein